MRSVVQLYPGPSKSLSAEQRSAKRRLAPAVPREWAGFVFPGDAREWGETVKLFRARFRPRPVMIMAPGATTPSAGLRAMPQFEPIHWPEHLPPFLDDAIRFSPDGLLWVQRTTAAEDPPAFDIVDPRGILV